MAFHKGVSISVFQNSGEQEFTSNWTEHVQRKSKQSPVPGSKDVIGVACDFWNRYEADIALAVSLGITSFRLSIEWHRVEPQPGQVNQDAIDRYHSMFRCLKDAGIHVVATLHHFVHPKWFQDRGGFLEEANVPLFTEFCTQMADEFQDCVDMWVTFNEPAVVCLTGHVFGIFPPEEILKFKKAGITLLNMLKAHGEVYDAIKAKFPSAQVGIVHQFIEMQPHRKWHFHTAFVSKWVNNVFAKRTTLEWFEHGTYRWAMPAGPDIVYEAPTKPKLDFLGLNYYSRLVLGGWFQMKGHEDEILSDSKFPVHAAGLTQHLLDSRCLNVPLYVTEFGAADVRDAVRPRLIREYYAAALTAMQEGADLRGMYLWTLVDNFEWHEAFKHHFGLYSCDMGSPDLERVPRSGSVATVKAIHAFIPTTVEEVRSKLEDLVVRCHEPVCCEAVATDAAEKLSIQEAPVDVALEGDKPEVVACEA
eukprot:jgi/Ulvmu1/7178/UM034_0087.1